MTTTKNDIPTIQALRHAARADLASANLLLTGQPGLTKDERLERLDQALVFINAAAEKTLITVQRTQVRDDAARDAEKAAEKAAAAAAAEAAEEDDNFFGE